jgi:hypothetical protein
MLANCKSVLQLHSQTIALGSVFVIILIGTLQFYKRHDTKAPPNPPPPKKKEQTRRLNAAKDYGMTFHILYDLNDESACGQIEQMKLHVSGRSTSICFLCYECTDP